MKEGRPDPPAVDASGLRVGVVAGRFHEDVTGALVDGAVTALTRHGADRDDIEVHWVPGAFELPVVLDRLAASGRYQALVGLGAVVRGQTPHFDYVAGAATHGIAAVAREHGVPVGFGLLTTDTEEQARARAGGDAGNKGEEAALSAVEVANLLTRL